MASPVAQWAGLAQKYGRKYKIPTNVLLGLIDVETGGTGRNDLTSPAGAKSITQFMPGTAKQYHVDVSNPESAIRGAAQYLTDLGYHRDAKHALASYNGGPGNPQYGYANEVLARAGKYTSASIGGTKAPALGNALSTPASAIDAPQTAGSALAASVQPRLGTVSPPPAPSFAAQVPTPKGYQPPPGVNTTPQPDIRQQLQQALNLNAPTPYQPSTVSPVAPVGDLGSKAGSYGAAPSKGFVGGYPLGKRGQVIGTPYTGTHAKAFNQAGGSDNWQSENAVDIRIPVGTPVYAEADGVLGNTGSLGQGGRFAGLRTNLISKGNAYYYAHLSKLGPGIKAGARVKKGQLLGYSGEANGVPHLHFAIQRGDPRKLVQ